MPSFLVLDVPMPRPHSSSTLTWSPLKSKFLVHMVSSSSCGTEHCHLNRQATDTASLQPNAGQEQAVRWTRELEMKCVVRLYAVSRIVVNEEECSKTSDRDADEYTPKEPLFTTQEAPRA